MEESRIVLKLRHAAQPPKRLKLTKDLPTSCIYSIFAFTQRGLRSILRECYQDLSFRRQCIDAKSDTSEHGKCLEEIHYRSEYSIVDGLLCDGRYVIALGSFRAHLQLPRVPRTTLLSLKLELSFSLPKR